MFLFNGLGLDYTRSSERRSRKDALHYAAENGRVDEINSLVKNGACLIYDDDDGKIALHYAAENGHLDAVKALVKHATHLVKNGPRIDMIDKYGQTALFRAAANGHLEVAEFLIKNGARIDAAYTAFIPAATDGHLEVVKFFLAIKEVRENKDLLYQALHGAVTHALFSLSFRHVLREQLKIAQHLVLAILEISPRIAVSDLNEDQRKTFSDYRELLRLDALKQEFRALQERLAEKKTGAPSGKDIPTNYDGIAHSNSQQRRRKIC